MSAKSPPPKPQSSALLQAVALKRHYDHQVALAEVSRSVQGGEALGLIGPDGAGKIASGFAVAVPAKSWIVSTNKATLPEIKSTTT